MANTFLVVKRNCNHEIMMVCSVFLDRKKAEEYATSANEWYGPLHPLTPLTVTEMGRFEPNPFPVEAIIRARKEEQKANVEREEKKLMRMMWE